MTQSNLFTESRQASPSRDIRSPQTGLLHILALVTLVELALLLYLLPSSLTFWTTLDGLRESSRSATRARELAMLSKDDPKPGAKLLGPSSFLLGAARDVGSAEDTILAVFVGPCTSCTGNRIRQWSEVAALRAGKPIVIVSRDTAQSIRKFKTSERCSIPIVADPDGTLMRKFNAIWVPRAYAISRGGSLTWIQTDDRMEPQAILQSAWRSGG